jgi:protein-S-isoprenylcysteine O-methyltransferase Ste14
MASEVVPQGSRRPGRTLAQRSESQLTALALDSRSLIDPAAAVGATGSEATVPEDQVPLAAVIRARVLYTRLFGLLVAILVLTSASGWEIAGSPLVGDVMFVAGALLAVAGFFGRLWALCYIGGRKKRQLITDGPYAMCRHPLYFFSLVGGVGLALCTERLAIAGLFVATCLLLVPLAIRSEDNFLAARFPAYEEYRRAVPALLPRPGLLRPPEDVVVEGRSLRRGLLEGAGFLAVVGILELIEALQVAGMLPYLFVLL